MYVHKYKYMLGSIDMHEESNREGGYKIEFAPANQFIAIPLGGFRYSSGLNGNMFFFSPFLLMEAERRLIGRECSFVNGKT